MKTQTDFEIMMVEYLGRMMVCEECGESLYQIRSHGNPSKNFQCFYCSKGYTVTKNTIFYRTHIPLVKWMYMIYCSIKDKKDILGLSLSNSTLEMMTKKIDFWKKRTKIPTWFRDFCNETDYRFCQDFENDLLQRFLGHESFSHEFYFTDPSVVIRDSIKVALRQNDINYVDFFGSLSRYL